jgi:phosphoglycolate phosphatase-like HAD superfamily hydrolase
MIASSNTGPGSPRLAWLFDIDGTLLTSDGAALEAFTHAFELTFGFPGDLEGVAFAGRTDPLILADILSKYDVRLAGESEARFWNLVFDHARRLIVPPRGHLMPGIPGVLDRVASERRWVPALLTGNMTQMAAIKLGRFGIERRFAFGAFGEMAVDRNALAQLAVARATQAYGIPAERCIVIGDTEHDVACARAAGARIVAVASGSRPREALAACAPDLLLDDLADPEPLFAWAATVEAGTLPAR